LTGAAESGKKIQLNERLAFRIDNDQANGAQPVQPMFSARGGTQRWLKWATAFSGCLTGIQRATSTRTW